MKPPTPTPSDVAPCPPTCPQCHGRGYILWPYQGEWLRMRCQAYGRNGATRGHSIIADPQESPCNSSKPRRKTSPVN